MASIHSHCSSLKVESPCWTSGILESCSSKTRQEVSVPLCWDKHVYAQKGPLISRVLADGGVLAPTYPAQNFLQIFWGKIFWLYGACCHQELPKRMYHDDTLPSQAQTSVVWPMCMKQKTTDVLIYGMLFAPTRSSYQVHICPFFLFTDSLLAWAMTTTPSLDIWDLQCGSGCSLSPPAAPVPGFLSQGVEGQELQWGLNVDSKWD